MDIEIFKKLDFSDKETSVYLTLLRLGPTSVRKLAEVSGLNRGSVYEALKWLQEQHLVDFYEKDAKQFFVAEDPERLNALVKERLSELSATASRVAESISELKSLHNKGTERPVARYFEPGEIHHILEDVLEAVEESGEMVYRIYSTAPIREELYRGFETFSDVRVGKGIAVKAIALGMGGELRGLDERKWLNRQSTTPTYIIVYAGKVASISQNAQGELIGVVIENEGVYETQKIIFDELWAKL
jgi:sugar-specific transcriptional regulator TrmB